MAELTLLSSTPGGLTDAQLDRNMQNLNEDLGTKQRTHANLAALSGLGGGLPTSCRISPVQAH